MPSITGYSTPWGPGGSWAHWDHSVAGLSPEPRYSPDLLDSFPGSFRRQAISQAQPLDGLYDSQDSTLIRRHLCQMEAAGIDGLLFSWWGIGYRSAAAFEKLLRLAPEGSVGIYFETRRVYDHFPAETGISIISSEIAEILQRFGQEKAILRIDGRPLVGIYIPDRGVGYGVADWLRFREELSRRGHNPWLLGDSLDPAYYAAFDCLHTYNPFDSHYEGQDLIALYRACIEAGQAEGKPFAASVGPGFDNRTINRAKGYAFERENGERYNQSWRLARALGSEIVLICTFNEWGEGTQIEPSTEWGDHYLALTRQNVHLFRGETVPPGVFLAERIDPTGAPASIGSLYIQIGGRTGTLGLPLEVEPHPTGPSQRGIRGWAQRFEGGEVFFADPFGAHALNGIFLEKFKALDGPSGVLGFPLTWKGEGTGPKLVGPSGVSGGSGRVMRFEGGSLYQAEGMGLTCTRGRIGLEYERRGGVEGPLGFPIGDAIEETGGHFRQSFEGGYLTSPEI